MPGILYVVATPIGNLEDITLRALRVLREAAVIAAEDTRRTARLLQHYSISTRTTSLHEHNEYAQSSSLIARLQAGESVALVSDAGTPLISDPGMLLVSAAHAAGIRVEPVPGPSAVMALLSGSGLPFQEFVFVGFPPPRSNARKTWLRGLAGEPRLLVLYETPHRIIETLNDIREILGERLVALGRELTKMHEELVVRPISAHLAGITAPKGEYTLAIAGPDPDAAAAPGIPDGEALLAEFGRMTEGGSRRDVVRKLADKYHVAPREMYRLLEQSRER